MFIVTEYAALTVFVKKKKKKKKTIVKILSGGTLRAQVKLRQPYNNREFYHQKYPPLDKEAISNKTFSLLIFNK